MYCRCIILNIFYNMNMDIMCKIVNIIIAMFFSFIIYSLLSNPDYFQIIDTAFFRIFSIITLISLWVPVFIRINLIVIPICILIFIIYFVLYISHPLL